MILSGKPALTSLCSCGRDGKDSRVPVKCGVCSCYVSDFIIYVKQAVNIIYFIFVLILHITGTLIFFCEKMLTSIRPWAIERRFNNQDRRPHWEKLLLTTFLLYGYLFCHIHRKNVWSYFVWKLKCELIFRYSIRKLYWSII